MITLRQFLETQNLGVRQNFFYRIVDAFELFQKSKTDDTITISRFREGNKYLKVEYIPEELKDHKVYAVEACYDEEVHCPYLKIVII